MRKSLLKTPPSGLSSRPGRPAAALVAVGVGRGRQSERTHSDGYHGIAPVGANGARAGADAEIDSAARLRLLEALVSRADIAECAQAGLQWLEETLGLRPPPCLVRPTGAALPLVVGRPGLSPA